MSLIHKARELTNKPGLPLPLLLEAGTYDKIQGITIGSVTMTMVQGGVFRVAVSYLAAKVLHKQLRRE